MKYNYEDYFDESYFTVGGDRGWYNKEAFALDNLWHRDYVAYICSILNIKNKITLDAGCARGNVVHWLNACEADAYGIDVSSWAVENSWVKEKIFQANIADEIPFGNEFFDIIISREVLEHILENDIRKTVAELGRVLKIGGTFMVGIATNRGGKEDRKKNTPGHVDPSHVLIRSLTWWKTMFESSGFFRINFEKTFNAMNSGFGYKYGWDQLVMERT